MRNRKVITMLIGCLVLIALGATLFTRDLGVQQSRYSSGETPLLQPVLASWEMADQPLVATNDHSFVAHVAVLTDSYTAVVYSMYAAETPGLSVGSSVKLWDDAGRVFSQTKTVPLYQLGGLEFGVVYFEPRSTDSHELHLSLSNPNASALLARVVGPGNKPTAPASLNAILYRENYVQQLGYQISFNGWASDKGDRVAKMLTDKGETTIEVFHRRATEEANAQIGSATSTPEIIEPTLDSLARGEIVDTEATLRVEDKASAQVYYLFFQLLHDKEAAAGLLP